VTELAAVVAELALTQGLLGRAVATETVGEEIEYRRGGRPFAVTGRSSADFRLRAEVAEAARRTPDVAPAARGPEWVRFTPPTLDRFALDRARAWFEFAWRHAAD